MADNRCPHKKESQRGGPAALHNDGPASVAMVNNRREASGLGFGARTAPEAV